VREGAALVEKAFTRFDAALTEVLRPDELDAAHDA
jgi:hypothetical protein